MKMLKMGCLGLLGLLLIVGFYGWLNLWQIRDDLTAKGMARLQVRATPAAGSVYMLEAVGREGRRRSAATAASVGPDGVLLVDTLHHGAEAKVRAALKKLGSDEIRFILATHFHLDHVGGIEALRQGATVVGHEGVERRLASPQKEFRLRSFPAQPGKLPDRTFSDSFSVRFNGEEVRVTHYPRAHTDSDSVVYFTGSNVLVTGDIYNGPGHFSTPSTLQGGDVEGLEAAIAGMLEQVPEDVKIIPGHGATGRLASRDDLETYHRLLRDTIQMVESKLAAGRAAKQIGAEGLPESWRDWPDPEARVDRWLRDLTHHLRKSHR